MSIKDIKDGENKNDKKKGCFAITNVAFKHDSEEESECEDQTPCVSADQTHNTIDSMEDSLIDKSQIEFKINKDYNDNLLSSNCEDVSLEYNESFCAKKSNQGFHKITKDNIDVIIRKEIEIRFDKTDLIKCVEEDYNSIDCSKRSINNKETSFEDLERDFCTREKENSIRLEDITNEFKTKVFERNESTDTLKGSDDNFEVKAEYALLNEQKHNLIIEIEKKESLVKKDVPNSRFKVYKLKSARGRWKCCDFFDDENAAIVYKVEDLRKKKNNESHKDDTTIQKNNPEFVIIDKTDTNLERAISKSKVCKSPLSHISIFNSHITGSSYCSKDEFFFNSLHIHSYHHNKSPSHQSQIHQPCFCHQNLQHLRTCLNNPQSPNHLELPQHPCSATSLDFHDAHTELFSNKCLSNNHNNTQDNTHEHILKNHQIKTHNKGSNNNTNRSHKTENHLMNGFVDNNYPQNHTNKDTPHEEKLNDSLSETNSTNIDQANSKMNKFQQTNYNTQTSSFRSPLPPLTPLNGYHTNKQTKNNSFVFFCITF